LSGCLFERESPAALVVEWTALWKRVNSGSGCEWTALWKRINSGSGFEWTALQKRVKSGSSFEWTALWKRVDSGSEVVGSSEGRLSTNPTGADTLRPFKYAENDS